jgi:AcrR family transcriptional regulator
MTPRKPPSTSRATADLAAISSADERPARLVAVAAQQISEQGMAATSARSVAAAADAAPSAINYNFGTLERLFSTAFEQGASRTADWLEARSHELRALPRSPEGAVRALEYVVVEWTRGARPLALLYQECLAASAGAGPGAAWTALWRDFWLGVAADFGLGEAEGRLLHLFFESEGLYHLSGWSPALEAAALGELVDHFGAVWLGAAPRAPIGALALAEQSAGVLAAGSIAPSAIRIAEAAAEVIEGGLGGLTHRAVAARAGVTTGAVTHHFRTIEDLVAGAIRGQVLALSSRTEARRNTPPVEQIGSRDAFIESLRFHGAGAQLAGPPIVRRQPFLATVRRPELAGAGAVIRFAHGGTGRAVLGRLFAPAPGTLELYAGVLSRLLSANWFACAGDEAPRESRERLIGEIEARLLRSLPVKTP